MPLKSGPIVRSNVSQVWQVTEIRVASKLHNEMQCCGGSVDVDSEYAHCCLRIDDEFKYWNQHVTKAECYEGYRE